MKKYKSVSIMAGIIIFILSILIIHIKKPKVMCEYKDENKVNLIKTFLFSLMLGSFVTVCGLIWFYEKEPLYKVDPTMF